MLQPIHLAHTPADLTLYVAVYREVENASSLKQQLLAGNTEFEYAFIDASMILSTKQALAAVFRAINDYLNHRLKSRNIHSEIVFCLSPNNNIGEAFRRFGVSDATKDLLVIKVATTPDVTLESVGRHLSTHVQGQESPFDDATFRATADLDRIRKVYKISSLAPKATGRKPSTTSNGIPNGENMDATKNLEVQILGLMALRGAT
ncbi:hypothetical protein A1O3_04307 [Capronia epimyces CBS 606.96]|uniref:EKC/KEOPS complex subunit CGI121 n=1 Tax=Capronia epimyces CBS 606.96 TaxID=1182542 RepID=W9Y4E4_9EURO|nr:uncharacterized protein A1O3_04307 [Capronia epimyces CBS 606.96]EXJ87348.1 hypothetical protein A1O3_04307 [Capronia epimyces CBS 606.96]